MPHQSQGCLCPSPVSARHADTGSHHLRTTTTCFAADVCKPPPRLAAPSGSRCIASLNCDFAIYAGSPWSRVGCLQSERILLSLMSSFTKRMPA